MFVFMGGLKGTSKEQKQNKRTVRVEKVKRHIRRRAETSPTRI